LVKAVGQSLAADAIQAVANQGVNLDALTSNTAGAAAKTGVLEAIREAMVQRTMQNYLNNGLRAGDTLTAVSGSAIRSAAYDQIRQQVQASLDPLINNLGNYASLISNPVTGNSLVDQILIDQNHIEDLRALDNKVTGDITVQELQFDNAVNDLDNARSALNYCRGLHPEYAPGAVTSGS
jgi:hypothetical protein